MKSQHAREEQAVVIATALALFVGVVLACWALPLSYRLVAGRWPAVDDAWSMLPVAVGAVVAVGYLARHRS